MTKAKICIPFFLSFILLLGGCAARTVDEMYCIPRRSASNESLRTAVESAMSSCSYAAPVSGDNQESVQTADLDGDGTEEYIIFAKNTQEDALQVLIFRRDETGGYGLWNVVECKGTSFEQALYAQIDGKPGMELVVGTRINERVTRTVSVYSFADGTPQKLKSMIYQKFLCTDLDSDGLTEVLVIQNGDYESDNAVSRLYSYRDGNIEGSGEVRLSAAPDEIQMTAVNHLSSGEPAVYIVSTWPYGGLVTDVLTFLNGELLNLMQSCMADADGETIYPEDIDSDGILEMPNSVSMMYESDGQILVRWFAVNANGDTEDKCYSLYDVQDGWYLILKNSMVDRILTERNDGTCTIFMWNNSYGTAVPVFTIYVLTGSDRDSQAGVQNRFALYRGEQKVYAAKLDSGSAVYGITESYLTENFHLIRENWTTINS